MRILTSHPCIRTESHNPLEDASLPDDGHDGQGRITERTKICDHNKGKMIGT